MSVCRFFWQNQNGRHTNIKFVFTRQFKLVNFFGENMKQNVGQCNFYLKSFIMKNTRKKFKSYRS